jgi:hypothetical protein
MRDNKHSTRGIFITHRDQRTTKNKIHYSADELDLPLGVNKGGSVVLFVPLALPEKISTILDPNFWNERSEDKGVWIPIRLE